MKLSNELQIKATLIHEKSKCLSFCPKFLHFIVCDTFKAVTKKLESCLGWKFRSSPYSGSGWGNRTVGARLRKQGFRIRDR